MCHCSLMNSAPHSCPLPPSSVCQDPRHTPQNIAVSFLTTQWSQFRYIILHVLCVAEVLCTDKVEHTLFKVQRHFLCRGSDVFETMFTLPRGDNKSEAIEPVELPDVTVAEFEALLTFFYDGMHQLTEDLEFWTNLLSISTRFCFDMVRARAIAEIDSSSLLNPVDRLYLAKKHDVPEWLQPAYFSICKRSEPLEVWEAQRIGWETAIVLAQVRESMRPHPIHLWDMNNQIQMALDRTFQARDDV
ncbi:hypothetical protein BC835DRAFT_1032678 [Cytidiella melzeri]|nr:hypothetical protein BC835DRAFT_1032678 [Cytidiella melzeri]